MASAPTDTRLTALREWITRVHLPGGFELAPASTDASFRRYFRITDGGKTWVAMDAPPPQEDCRPFVRVAALMLDAGLHAPRVVAQDLERGFLLLTDLGATTYLNGFDADNPQIGRAHV